ncbi:eukaryotic translation initiation factor 2A isoform X1 [Lycorma delicatula]|uniref:eukaryotic translation initiation factor 2A isoform X1 n=2 Tax=Lycorma delicatula TaxID=130591 RepID=UPI003F512051
MALPVPVVAVRGSTGIAVNQGPPSYDIISGFTRDISKSCKAMQFSPDGRYFTWVNGAVIKIVSTATWSVVAEIQRPKVCCLDFSPKGTYLVTWEPFIVSQANPHGSPNLHIFKCDTGELVHVWTHKRQSDWQLQWSSDEKICARSVTSDVVFFNVPEFNKSSLKITNQKVETFSIAPEGSPVHVVCYVPGKSGPSFGKLYQYPKFDTPIASKSFFQADKVDILWKRKGTGVLLLTSVEVDKSGSSYYGKQSLHFMSCKGETAMVLLSKEGPIYSVEWSPIGNEFCVVYGLVPAKATLFNLKCEPIFEFGSGPRNAIYYNPFGNILLLGGFGNLRGQVELWDMTERRLIARMDAPDTTLLAWSPDGEHFMTATTAPRLRMCNGFKIWHYTGTLLYERPWNKQEELWEVLWQKFPPGTFKPPVIRYKPVEGIQPSQPVASKQAYRPPSARGKESNFKLHDEDEPASGDVIGNPSKAALKQKKKREAKKAAKQQQINNGESVPQTTASSNGTRVLPFVEEITTDDPEKLKKIKKLKSKLVEINRLKEQKAQGKQLEINQLDKINKEDSLMKELKDLTL